MQAKTTNGKKRTYKHWTDKQIRQMAEWKRKGLTYAEIGEKVGRHGNTVFTILQRQAGREAASGYAAKASKLEAKIDKLLEVFKLS